MSQKDLASLKGLLDDPSFADVLAEGPGKFASRITKYFRDNPRPGPNSDTEQATTSWSACSQCLMSTCARAILSSPNFHSLNLADDNTQAAKDLVNRLVRLDRMPKKNTAEALLLLQDAWDEYDVAMMADRYKLAFKINFILQLVFGIFVIFASTISSILFGVVDECKVPEELLYSNWSKPSPPPAPPNALWLQDGEVFFKHVIFLFSLLISLLVSLEGIFNSKSRWRVLRASSGSLESMIWCYRTRVLHFELEQQHQESNRAERNLREMLNDWRDELVSSANLAMSNLAKKHNKTIFKHFQHRVCSGPAKWIKSGPLLKYGNNGDQGVVGGECRGYQASRQPR